MMMHCAQKAVSPKRVVLRQEGFGRFLDSQKKVGDKERVCSRESWPSRSGDVMRGG